MKYLLYGFIVLFITICEHEEAIPVYHFDGKLYAINDSVLGDMNNYQIKLVCFNTDSTYIQTYQSCTDENGEYHITVKDEQKIMTRYSILIEEENIEICEGFPTFIRKYDGTHYDDIIICNKQ